MNEYLNKKKSRGDYGRQETLPPSLQNKMSQSFGMDFSSVKLYRNDEMSGTGMQGLASGNRVIISKDVDLNSKLGQAVLGHELSHIRAQSQGIGMGNSGLYDNAALEHQADIEGMMAANGQSIFGERSGMNMGAGMQSMGTLSPLSGGLATSAGAPMQAIKPGKCSNTVSIPDDASNNDLEENEDACNKDIPDHYTEGSLKEELDEHERKRKQKLNTNQQLNTGKLKQQLDGDNIYLPKDGEDVFGIHAQRTGAGQYKPLSGGLPDNAGAAAQSAKPYKNIINAPSASHPTKWKVDEKDKLFDEAKVGDPDYTAGKFVNRYSKSKNGIKALNKFAKKHQVEEANAHWNDGKSISGLNMRRMLATWSNCLTGELSEEALAKMYKKLNSKDNEQITAGLLTYKRAIYQKLKKMELKYGTQLTDMDSDEIPKLLGQSGASDFSFVQDANQLWFDVPAEYKKSLSLGKDEEDYEKLASYYSMVGPGLMQKLETRSPKWDRNPEGRNAAIRLLNSGVKLAFNEAREIMKPPSSSPPSGTAQQNIPPVITNKPEDETMLPAIINILDNDRI